MYILYRVTAILGRFVLLKRALSSVSLFTEYQNNTAMFI